MFSLHKRGGVWYYTIDSFDQTGLVRHSFTTRRGGVSAGIYESMNLRFHSEDARENVLENFILKMKQPDRMINECFSQV